MEIELGTDPQNVDSDYDDLTDGDEVNVYGTDPTKFDTDGDTIGDGDELILGLNPLLVDGDGDGIPDNEEKIEQEKSVEIVEEEKPEVTEVTIKMSGTGYLEKTTTIESVFGIDLLSSDVVGLVGAPVEINTTSEFDEAVISFKIDKAILTDEDLEYLSVMWYDEANNTFELMDTQRNIEDGIISTTTTHFSTYMVVDAREWFSAWNKDLNSTSHQYQPSVKVHTVMAVDCSGSMKWNDPITTVQTYTPPYNSINICDRYNAVTNFISCMDSDDKAAIYTFDDTINLACDITSDKTLLTNAVCNFYSDGDTNISEVIAQATDKLATDNEATRKIIILLSDGKPDPYVTVPDSVLTKARNAFIKIHTVCLGYDCDEAEMQRIADSTGGTCFKAVNSDELKELYGNIAIGADFDKTDTDKDGFPDVIEINGIRTQTGKIIKTNHLSKHSDEDGLEDGVEIDPQLTKFTYTAYYAGRIFTTTSYGYKMTSDPTENDTDGDGLTDDIDPKQISIYNNGIKISLNKTQINNLQIWLVNLGYLNMQNNPYGEDYGVLTNTAVNLYQLNHSFKMTDMYIDDITYATIANDYCLKNNNNENQYLQYVSSVSNKNYYNDIFIVEPILQQSYINSGITIELKSNSSIKQDYEDNDKGEPIEEHQIYLYNYSKKIQNMINTNMDECKKNNLSQIKYLWFYLKCGIDKPWDIKIERRWNEQLKGLPYVSRHFPFVYNNAVMTPESLENLTYGYWGTTLHIDWRVLLAAGDATAEGNHDSLDDKQWIMSGINLYCIDTEDWEYLPIYSGFNGFNDDGSLK